MLRALIAVSLVAGLWASSPCNTDGASCRPWNNHYPCAINDRITIKVMFDSLTADVGEADYTTYGFCPLVDQLSAYAIQGAANNSLVDHSAATPAFATSFNAQGFNTTLGIYGMGSTNNTQIPDISAFSRAIYAMNISDCASDEIAIATFLVLNITLLKGIFGYREDQLAQFVGFESTCSGGYCLFGDTTHKCIGNGVTANCAKCYNATGAQYARINIWASYYGTDKGGFALQSGQSNPINFRQFAASSAYDTIAGDLTNQASNDF